MSLFQSNIGQLSIFMKPLLDWLVHSFTHLFIQKVYIECQPEARCWAYGPCLRGTYSLVKEKPVNKWKHIKCETLIKEKWEREHMLMEWLKKTSFKG